MKKIALITAFPLLLSGICLASTSETHTNPLSTASDLMIKARDSYEIIKSYQADFTREYPLEDGDSESIFIRYEKPKSVYMHWLEGRQRGLQVLYAKGHYDDKILARPQGFLFSFIPIVHLDKDDPRVAAEESHSIENAGVGHFLESFGEDFDYAKENGLLSIQEILSVQVEGEEAVKIRTLFDIPDKTYPRIEVAFSKAHHMPIEIALYKEGDVPSEIYRYLNLTTNVNREDEYFKKNIDGRLYTDYLKT